MEYLETIKEKANEYALHFYPYLKKEIKRGTFHLATHLRETCDFDKTFYEELFAEVWDDVSRNFSIYLFSSDEEIKKMKEQVKEEFLIHFKKEYLLSIDESLEGIKEEYKFSKEDYRYYKERLYEKEKEIIGDVSEEERTLLMSDAEKREDIYEQEKISFENAKKEIQFSFFVY